MNFQSFYLETARQLCHVTFRAKFSAPLLEILTVKTFTLCIFPQSITHTQMNINYRTWFSKSTEIEHIKNGKNVVLSKKYNGKSITEAFLTTQQKKYVNLMGQNLLHWNKSTQRLCLTFFMDFWHKKGNLWGQKVGLTAENGLE